MRICLLCGQAVRRPSTALVIAGWSASILVLLAIVGFAISVFSGKTAHQRETGAPLPPSVPGVEQRELDRAYEDARLAQEAAEKLSEMLSKLEITRGRIQRNQTRPQPDAEAIEADRVAKQMIERQIADSEAAFLLKARELQKYLPAIQAYAFARLEQQVSTTGVEWRKGVADLLRQHLPSIPADATRVEPGFREELKKLQSPP